MSISLVSSWSEIIVPSESVRASAPPSADNIRTNKPAAEAVAATTQASPERVAEAVKQVNEVLNSKGQNLYAALETDKATGINVVKFLDKNTKEVISQFPSKEILAIAEVLGQSQEDKGQLLYVSA